MIDENSWQWAGGITLATAGWQPSAAMKCTVPFNCGVDMVIAVPVASANQALGILAGLGETRLGTWRNSASRRRTSGDYPLMKRLVVLISGEGSNLQALIETCQQGKIVARIATVISHRAAPMG